MQHDPQADEAFMRMAIDVAEEGIAAGQSPFGAVIVRQGALIARTHNTVWHDLDPTAHAEVNCIRRAAAELRTINLSGCVIYSTCEPCPMCLAAVHWSRIDRVAFGAGIDDAAAAGFHELHMAARVLATQGHSSLHVDSGLLLEECQALFALWKAAGLSRPY